MHCDPHHPMLRKRLRQPTLPIAFTKCCVDILAWVRVCPRHALIVFTIAVFLRQGFKFTFIAQMSRKMLNQVLTTIEEENPARFQVAFFAWFAQQPAPNVNQIADNGHTILTYASESIFPKSVRCIQCLNSTLTSWTRSSANRRSMSTSSTRTTVQRSRLWERVRTANVWSTCAALMIVNWYRFLLFASNFL